MTGPRRWWSENELHAFQTSDIALRAHEERTAYEMPVAVGPWLDDDALNTFNPETDMKSSWSEREFRDWPDGDGLWTEGPNR